MKFIERYNYNRVITVKLVLPEACNYRCEFCYNNDNIVHQTKERFLENFIPSLDRLLGYIGDKNEVSLDITGGEPTLSPSFFCEVMRRLKEFEIKKKVLRVTLTTNGIGLEKCIDSMDGVVDYVNISTHHFDKAERERIFGGKSLDDEDYKRCVEKLREIGVTTSTCAVIHKEVNRFEDFMERYVQWCESIGFIALRFRCNVFWERGDVFDGYMEKALRDSRYTVIDHENTPDSHWCRLRRFDKFRVFFLHGVKDTSRVTKGIEYVVHDDGEAYCDFYKRKKVNGKMVEVCGVDGIDGMVEIGKIYDVVE